jgi:hypothetical protein
MLLLNRSISDFYFRNKTTFCRRLVPVGDALPPRPPARVEPSTLAFP